MPTVARTQPTADVFGDTDLPTSRADDSRFVGDRYDWVMSAPIWRGDGMPVEMWLLQLDLANHSRWTHELNSYADAYRYRRDFATRIASELHAIGFDRFSWGGDGGVFVADGRSGVGLLIDGAARIHSTFAEWRSNVRSSDRVGLHVSGHRALVTTADDPAYCFGSELNEFIKRERDLRNASTHESTTITSAVYRLLSREQQSVWSLRGDPVGTLGRVYSLTDTLGSFGWLAGPWHSTPSDSWAYAALDSTGDPFVVYCYSGDDRHTGSYENFRWDGDELVGTFAWVDAPIAGHFRLKPRPDKSQMTAGWWLAEDVAGNGSPPFGTAGMTAYVWTKDDNKEIPPWAHDAIVARQRLAEAQHDR